MSRSTSRFSRSSKSASQQVSGRLSSPHPVAKKTATRMGHPAAGRLSPADDIVAVEPVWRMRRIGIDGYACSFVLEDQPGAGDWAGAGGWVSWAGDAVSDAGAA